MRVRPWHVAILCTALAFAWQWVVAAGYFQGNWNGFFYAGDRFVQSPPVKAEASFVFPNSSGYDAQLYHAIAHDPLDLHGTDRFLDAPHTRYSRILIPGLSYLLGFGQLFWVDRAYRALELLFLFLGVACMGAYLERYGRSCWWGAAFLLVPGVFISIERQLTDLALCALIVAALLSAERGNRLLCWLALAAGCLDRDTGAVAVAGFVLAALWERRPREAGIWATAVLPAIAWNIYVIRSIPESQALQLGLSYPLASVVAAVRHLQPYPFPPAIVQGLHALDLVAIAGALLAFVLGVWVWIRKKNTLTSVSFAFAIFGVSASTSLLISDFTDVYAFARHNSPLLFALLLQAIQRYDVKLAGPLALVLPRSVIPIASMTLRSLRHLLLFSS